MENIYCLSGLGADERLFASLDLGNQHVVHIPWGNPGSHRDLTSYAASLAKGITSEKPVLLGVSLGGIVAVEIAKHIPAARVILISSAKTYKELPSYYRIAAKLGFHKLGTRYMALRFIHVVNWFFGLKKKDEQMLVWNMILDTHVIFFRWAARQILSWRNIFLPTHCIHIHGTADRVIPFRNVSATHVIEGGCHLMVVDRAAEISEIIKQALAPVEN